MNKNDKAFITGLFKGLESHIGGLEGRFDGLEGRFEKRFEALEFEDRRNGMLLEELRDDLKLQGEGYSFIIDRLDQIGADVSEIKATIIDYPIIREMVKKHDRQLEKLTKVR